MSKKTIKYVADVVGGQTVTTVAKFLPRRGIWILTTRYSGESLPRDARTCYGFDPDLFRKRGPGWPGVTGRYARAALVRVARWPGDTTGEVPPKRWCA